MAEWIAPQCVSSAQGGETDQGVTKIPVAVGGSDSGGCAGSSAVPSISVKSEPVTVAGLLQGQACGVISGPEVQFKVDELIADMQSVKYTDDSDLGFFSVQTMAGDVVQVPVNLFGPYAAWESDQMAALSAVSTPEMPALLVDSSAPWEPGGSLYGGKYELHQGLLFRLESGGVRRLIIPAGDGLQQDILEECHDSVAGGHLGTVKTAEKVGRLFFWPKWWDDVAAYVTTCTVCQQQKSRNTKPATKSKFLSIPSRPWHTVSIDFIGPLPESDGFDSICTVVDKFSKRAYFLPCTVKMSADEVADLLGREVFANHGLPEVIISDRDPRFTGKFWPALFAALGTKLKMSTVYHPQTDGQAEAANRVIQQMIRSYVGLDRRSWHARLWVLQYAYNDSVHTRTGFTPFFMDTGRNPRSPLSFVNLDAAAVVDGKVQHVGYTLQTLRQCHDAALRSMEAAARTHASVNQRRYSAPAFEVGDEVMLSTKNLRFESGKLSSKWAGPFTVQKVLSEGNAVELELPAEWKCSDVRNVSELKRYRSDQGRFPGRPAGAVEIPMPTGEAEYEVDEVLGKRGSRGKVEYLVKWRGLPVAEATWEPAHLVTNAWDTVLKFENRRHKAVSANVMQSANIQAPADWIGRLKAAYQLDPVCAALYAHLSGRATGFVLHTAPTVSGASQQVEDVQAALHCLMGA
jgi:hypothetical protein